MQYAMETLIQTMFHGESHTSIMQLQYSRFNVGEISLLIEF
jgi:hypothetical protein